MPKYKLRKPVLGIDQLSDETSLRADRETRITAVREATNVDIDEDGNVNRRDGYTLKLSGTGYHSLYSSRRGWLMACFKDQLGIYTPSSNVFDPLTNMGEAYLTSFDELNGNIYYSNPGANGMIRKGESAVRTLGVHLPDVTAGFAASTGGSFPPGQYGVTYSIVDDNGEESGLTPLMVITLTERSSIQGTAFTLVSGHKYRIYITTTDGTELYQAAEFDADTASFLISDHEEGRQPKTQFLDLLPFGYHLKAFGSRLFVGTDDFVFYSEAFQPHLSNTAHSFLPCTGFVSMLQPIKTGVYIADQAGVRFYRGEDPTTFEVMEVSTEHVVFGTAVAVPGEFLPRELGNSDVAAVWLSPSGYQVGLPSGEVVRLHSSQVQLPKYVQGCAAFSVRDGRKQLVTPVNSNVLADASVALDSSIS